MHVRGGFVKFRVGLEGEPTSGATTRAPHTKDHAGLAVLAVVEDAEVVMPRLVVVDHGGVGTASEIGHGNANVAPDGRGKEDLVPKVEHQGVSDLAAAVTLAPVNSKPVPGAKSIVHNIQKATSVNDPSPPVCDHILSCSSREGVKELENIFFRQNRSRLCAQCCRHTATGDAACGTFATDRAREGGDCNVQPPKAVNTEVVDKQWEVHDELAISPHNLAKECGDGDQREDETNEEKDDRGQQQPRPGGASPSQG
eukprot:CAMPEP_0175837124 /NCGR_PEP_ID=MMETSP0107_2-20121207/17518_1 /TAXON_ID=195067 ORGANISM="Goniomonas pacifica, Strain CCMP1869" /NCGR_SAMPLE_ID=MMETSP0107_2 /ASSEMBLY_ACC=CAM_ASM_000203 /LENGTH=254 /DNA_ID=CAMNT_0017150583 /DNA_START=63 /DNA_END=827 /DNA_ORIENTATION=-